MALEMKTPVMQKPQRTLSGRLVAVVVAGLLLVVGWSFYMGFLVGRGQNPEERLQKIADVWQGAESGPAAQEPAAGPAEPAAEEAQPEAVAVSEAAEPQPAAPEGAGPQVVPGYPVFPSSQAEQPAAQEAAANEAAAREAKAKEARETAAREARAKEARAKEAAAREAKAKEAKAKDAKAKEAAKAAAPGTEVYQFTYRMCTVSSMEGATREQARYEAKGFRTIVRAVGSSYALFHTFSGTDADCAAFLAKVKSAGLGEPRRTQKRKK